MRHVRSLATVLLAIVTPVLVAQSPGSRPGSAELARRDRWVEQHFPASLPAPPDAAAAAMLTAETGLGPVFQNRLPNLPLQVANRAFAHGLFCHAPCRVRVQLPAPAQSLTAAVGILDNPASQGGSVVFAVEVGDRQCAASPVMHRGETGAELRAKLSGAREFELVTSTAGDGLYSDQGVWGEATVTLTDGRQLRLGDLPLQDALQRPRDGGPLPFSFTCGGVGSDRLLPKWEFAEQRHAAGIGKTSIARTWTDPDTGLCVTCTAVVYTDFPTVEWTLHFENRGTVDSPMLSGILPLDVRCAGDDFLLHHFRGSTCQANDYEPREALLQPRSSLRIVADGGRPTNTWMPYFDVETGSGGVIAVLGWAGQWAARFTRDDGVGLRIAAGQEATAFRLHPGEQVRSPIAVLQCYDGDWLRGQNLWRAWMLAHNVPRHDGRTLSPFVFGCTGNYYPGLKTDAATELQFFQGYQDRGILPDYWDQDAGWYPCGDGWWNTGTWEVDKTRWPEGLRQGSDWLHRHGAGSIVWFEPERAAAGSWLTTNHPEWCFGGAGGGLMRIGDPAYRAWITDRIDQLITEQGIDFYRQDFNIDPLYTWRGSDADDRQGLAELRHVEGYFALWDELQRRHPQLWIDSCASGGRRNDLETLRRAVPILRSDYAGDPKDPGYDPLSQQNHVYGISFWMPFHGSGFGHVDPYWTRSLMGPIVGIGVDTRLEDLDYALLQKLYRQLRQVQPCYLGDYWPLTPYCADASQWVAWQFDLPLEGHGIVQAFRRKNCPTATITLPLRGLDAAQRYRLEDLDGGAGRELSGRELQAGGLELRADAAQTALLWTYRRLP